MKNSLVETYANELYTSPMKKTSWMQAVEEDPNFETHCILNPLFNTKSFLKLNSLKILSHKNK